MASSAIPGFEGHVFVSTDGGTTFTKLCELREVTLTVERDTIDVTSHCSNGWKDNITGNAMWNASADALYVQTDAPQNALWDALISRDSLLFQFIPKGENAQTGDQIWQGTGIITSYELSLPNDDASAVSVEILGQGEIQRIAAP